MVELLIIADDLTGALDTGVKFATAGIGTEVTIGRDYPDGSMDIPAAVLIIDADTRHLPSYEAGEVIRCITRKAVERGIPYIYKKTDSALRGNIGSELRALYEEAGQEYLSFIPGWPRMGRTVKQGILYINGEKVSSSVFGSDPFEPVRSDRVKDIITEQAEVPICEVGRSSNEGQGIRIYDTKTEEELYQIAEHLKESGKLGIMAGCAGFASVLPELLELPTSEKMDTRLPESLFIVCGSVNPVTKKQLDYAEYHGFQRIRLTPEQKLDAAYWKTLEGRKQLDQWARTIKSESRCVLDSNGQNGNEDTLNFAAGLGMSREQIRVQIADTLGYILQQMVLRGVSHTLMVTGGDTLLGFMERIGQRGMHIAAELQSGCVLSEVEVNGQRYPVISKSGGFGEEALFCRLADQISTGGEKYVTVL